MLFKARVLLWSAPATGFSFLRWLAQPQHPSSSFGLLSASSSLRDLFKATISSDDVG